MRHSFYYQSETELPKSNSDTFDATPSPNWNDSMKVKG